MGCGRTRGRETGSVRNMIGVTIGNIIVGPLLVARRGVLAANLRGERKQGA